MAADVSFGLDTIRIELQLAGQNGLKMTRNLKTRESARTNPDDVVKASRRGSGARTDSTSREMRVVTPTSERIIKETSVKRRKAMEVLANR